MSGTLVLGIGNRLAGDDAAGNLVIDALVREQQASGPAFTAGIEAIDTGMAPESYTSVVRQHRPDLLILVDAADMGLAPGSLRVITPQAVTVLSFSTHNMPLSMLMSYVKQFCGALVLVGVQPGQTRIGSELSRAVDAAIAKLTEVILQGRIADIALLDRDG
jgi:hydrogenase 3 maturation protease